MDWVRLARATFVALFVSSLLGALFLPPDPTTQLIGVGLSLALLPLAHEYDSAIRSYSWSRHLLFVGLVIVVQFGWQLLVGAGVVVPDIYSPTRLVVLLAGVLLAGWLAYFGGLEQVSNRHT